MEFDKRNRFLNQDIIVRRNLREEEQKERKRESKKRISKGKFRSNSSSIRLCVHACGEENAFNSIQKFKHTLPMFDNGALILIKGLTLKLNIHGAEGVNLFTL